ncbi:nuclear factor 7, brain-like [Pelobates cultripes]|uniref:Nuclear factor 7, brain-like n=1 Tax=Pelobates cultripes TaxID=61616 RepID=A0AAD1WAV7_PELCU|nr:nuclear factor 7, brain-like [Pelobates cultripes]
MNCQDPFPDSVVENNDPMSEVGQEDNPMALPSSTQDIIPNQNEKKGPVHVCIRECIDDKDDKSNAIHQLLQLKKSMVELLDAYDEKMSTMHTVAFQNRERLAQSFQDLNHYLLREKETQLATGKDKEIKLVQNLDERVLDLVRMATSVEDMLLKLEQKKPRRWKTPAMNQIKDAKDKLREFSRSEENLEGQMSAVQLREWRGLRHFVKPIPETLYFDPQSAHPNLVLSPDLKQVKVGFFLREIIYEKHCFMPGIYILGKPGFHSGKHYWEVDVGQKTNWIIGVAKESVKRKENQDLSPTNGYWVLRKAQDHVFYCLEASHLCLKMKASPMRIGIYLDFSSSHLSFYNVDLACLIFELSDLPIEEALFPFFCPGIPLLIEDFPPLTLIN